MLAVRSMISKQSSEGMLLVTVCSRHTETHIYRRANTPPKLRATSTAAPAAP